MKKTTLVTMWPESGTNRMIFKFSSRPYAEAFAKANKGQLL